MKLTRVTLIAATTLVLAGALAACGGDDDDESTPTSVNTPAASSTAVTGGDTPEPQPTTGAPDGSPGTNDDVAEIKALVDKLVAATFTADYALTGNVGEPLAGGTLHLAKDGVERIRVERSTSESRTVAIQTQEQSVQCFDPGELAESVGAPAGEGVCLVQPRVRNLLDDLQQFVESDVVVLQTSQREIAGVSVKCHVMREENGEITNVCINNDGVLLAVEGPDGAKLEVTVFTMAVDEADFELPYPVRDLPQG